MPDTSLPKSNATRTAGTSSRSRISDGARRTAPRAEALLEAKDLLRFELIATTIREGESLPEPSRAGKGRPLVVPPVQIALKAALYDAWRQAGISQRHLLESRLPKARCGEC